MAGAGPYTLVWASLARSVVNTGLVWLFLSSGWKPAWRLNWQELRPYLRFGVSAVSSAIVSNVNNMLDVIVLGKFVPASSLGLYSVPRNFYTGRLSGRTDITFRPGQVGRITYPRYGLQAGRKVLVTSVISNPVTGRHTIRFWGA